MLVKIVHGVFGGNNFPSQSSRHKGENYDPSAEGIGVHSQICKCKDYGCWGRGSVVAELGATSLVVVTGEAQHWMRCSLGILSWAKGYIAGEQGRRPQGQGWVRRGGECKVWGLTSSGGAWLGIELLLMWNNRSVAPTRHT